MGVSYLERWVHALENGDTKQTFEEFTHGSNHHFNGEGNPNAKLTEDAVRRIHQLVHNPDKVFSPSQLAREYEVSTKTIKGAAPDGPNWNHVPCDYPGCSNG